MAEAFLSTLGLGPPAPDSRGPLGDQQALPLPPGLGDSAPPLPYAEKPLDLFKAIFEDSDSSEDEDAAVEQAGVGEAPPGGPEGPGASGHPAEKEAPGPSASVPDRSRPDNGPVPPLEGVPPRKVVTKEDEVEPLRQRALASLGNAERDRRAGHGPFASAPGRVGRSDGGSAGRHSPRRYSAEEVQGGRAEAQVHARSRRCLVMPVAV